MKRIKLQKHGTSKAIIIPADLISLLELQDGIIMTLENNKIILQADKTLDKTKV